MSVLQQIGIFERAPQNHGDGACQLTSNFFFFFFVEEKNSFVGYRFPKDGYF